MRGIKSEAKITPQNIKNLFKILSAKNPKIGCNILEQICEKAIKIEKYVKSVEKKLINKVKASFNNENGYQALKPALKTKIANKFIAICAEAMIADDANRAQASVVKQTKGFIEAKNNLVNALLSNLNFPRIVSG